MSKGIFSVGLDTNTSMRSSMGNGSLWLNLRDGDTAFITFFDKPSEMTSYMEHNYWRGKPENSARFPCIGEENGCPGCLPPIIEYAKPKWHAVASVLVINRSTGEKTPKLLGFGPMIKNQVLSIAGIVTEDNFVGQEMALGRTGKGLKTRYTLNLTNQKHDLTGIEPLNAEEHINPKDLDGINKLLDGIRPETDTGTTITPDGLAQLQALVE